MNDPTYLQVKHPFDDLGRLLGGGFTWRARRSVSAMLFCHGQIENANVVSSVKQEEEEG